MAAELERFPKIRYFHWRPKILKSAAFPLPEHGNLPRERELQRNLFLSVLSAARLCKNLLLTNIAHAVRVRPLLRRNAIVLVDRYYYNYYLDPVSVKYYGPAWLLDRLRSFFPRPDLVVVLKAPAEVLRARKQELSGEQILRQTAILNQLRFDAGHTMEMDASQPAPEIARAIMRKLVEITA
jgi:thymidylate kinase